MPTSDYRTREVRCPTTRPPDDLSTCRHVDVSPLALHYTHTHTHTLVEGAAFADGASDGDGARKRCEVCTRLQAAIVGDRQSVLRAPSQDGKVLRAFLLHTHTHTGAANAVAEARPGPVARAAAGAESETPMPETNGLDGKPSITKGIASICGRTQHSQTRDLRIPRSQMP